jgi:heat shock protein HslJ
MHIAWRSSLQRFTAAALLLAAALAAAACSTLPFGPSVEPPMITIRNRSHEDIAVVTLRETGRNPDQTRRFGSISPVPAGVSQSYRRAKSSPRLPGTVTLEWTDGQGRTTVRDLPLSKALRSATGAADEALVFEIGPYEDVRVFVERTARPGPAGTEATAVPEGGPWLLLELQGSVVQLPAGERHPSIAFQRQDGKVAGFSGCNDFFGGYERRGDALTIGPIGMTRRFCADAAGGMELAFLEVLSKVRSWRIEERVLLLLDGDLVLARFRQETQRTAP